MIIKIKIYLKPNNKHKRYHVLWPLLPYLRSTFLEVSVARHRKAIKGMRTRKRESKLSYVII